SRRRASAISTASSASERAVPTCSMMWLRPSRRSAIWTFVAPERPADLRTNTIDLDLTEERGTSLSRSTPRQMAEKSTSHTYHPSSGTSRGEVERRHVIQAQAHIPTAGGVSEARARDLRAVVALLGASQGAEH